MAQAILAAIRVKIARGTEPHMAVDEFAPPSSARNRIEHWIQEYLEEQGELCERRELSPTHVRELRRCARPDGYFSWWYDRSLSEIDALFVNLYAKHLRGFDL